MQRRVVLPYYGEFDQFNVVAGVVEDSVDQLAGDPGPSGSRSDIHSGEHPLMSFFAFQRNKEASNAKKVTAAERSEHRGAGEPVSKPCQRLAGLGLVGTAVGFGVAKQCFKTNLAIQHGVFGAQPADFGCNPLAFDSTGCPNFRHHASLIASVRMGVAE